MFLQRRAILADCEGKSSLRDGFSRSSPVQRVLIPVLVMGAGAAACREVNGNPDSLRKAAIARHCNTA